MVGSRHNPEGYVICPVCGSRHGGPVTGKAAFLGWAMCIPHEVMQQEGYVAVIEVAHEPEGETALEQLEEIERTGNIFFILRERWEAVAWMPLPEAPVVFTSPSTMIDIRAASQRALH